MESDKFFEVLGLTKVFKFKGKKYKWICTWWQFVFIMLGSVVAFYAFILNFFLLDIIING